MFLVELPFAIALVMWGRWIGGKYGAPRWVRWSGWAVAVVWAVTAAASTYALVSSARALDAEAADATQKARLLAEGISEAMHLALAGAGILAGGAGLLLVLTWRYHWAAKPPPVPRDPPYR